MNKVLLKGLRLILSKTPALYSLYATWLGKKVTKQLGNTRGILLLSFDMDYAADHEAASILLPVLRKFEIPVTWAAVGKWMQTYPELYREILACNRNEIMNHSWSHPDQREFRPGDLRKFHQISAEEATYEINQLHTYCLEQFGYQMVGFRFPHFRFHPAAKPILKRLGYSYTSNHLGLQGDSFGLPFLSRDGLVEIPLSIIPRKPGRIVEIYRLFRKPDGLYKDEKQFFSDFCALLQYTEKYHLVSVIYMDPCDVINLREPNFTQYFSIIKEAKIDVLTYRQFAERWKAGSNRKD